MNHERTAQNGLSSTGPYLLEDLRGEPGRSTLPAIFGRHLGVGQNQAIALGPVISRRGRVIGELEFEPVQVPVLDHARLVPILGRRGARHTPFHPGLPFRSCAA